MNDISAVSSKPTLTALYLRSARSGIEGRQNLARQRACCHRFLAAATPDDVPKPVEFTDYGSGLTADHPDLLALISAAQAGSISRVVVPSLDRIARSHAVIIRVFNMLEAAGVRVQTADRTIDSASPEGKLVMGMLAAFSEHFSTEETWEAV